YELLQRELTRLVAVAACALDGDEFHGDLGKRKIREFRELTLHDYRPVLALQRVYAEQHGHRSGARSAVKDDVHALTPCDLHSARECILFLDINDVIGAQSFGYLHPRAVFGSTGHNDERSARLLTDHSL